MELSTLAAIAQIAGTLWIVLLGSKTVVDVMHDMRGKQISPANHKFLTLVSLAIIVLILFLILLPYVHSVQLSITGIIITLFLIALTVVSIRLGTRHRSASGYPEQQDQASVLIQFLTGTQAGRTFPILKPVTTIGRVPDNDVRMDDPTISRYHARIVKQGMQWSIEKLNPQNTVTVNKRDVQQSAPIYNGDEIGLGPIVTFRWMM